MTVKFPNPGDEIIRSRDVIHWVTQMQFDYDNAIEQIRMEYTEAAETPVDQRNATQQAMIESHTSMEDAEQNLIEDYFQHDLDEFEALTSLNDEGKDIADWSLGVILIHEDHFEEFAKQTIIESGVIVDAGTWLLAHINWEDAAEEMKGDYTAVDYGGETYYVR